MDMAGRRSARHHRHRFETTEEINQGHASKKCDNGPARDSPTGALGKGIHAEPRIAFISSGSSAGHPTGRRRTRNTN